MTISIHSLQKSSDQFFSSISPLIGDWMGKIVRWIQVKSSDLSFPQFQIQSQWGAVSAIIAADVLICQLAYRIAHLLDPKNNFFQGTWRNHQVNLGTLFCVGFSLGVFAFTKMVRVPLATSTCIGLHIGALGCGMLSIAAVELLRKG